MRCLFPILFALLLAPALAAHSIERTTSFLQLDASVNAVAAVEVKEGFTREKGAKLQILKVFRNACESKQPLKEGEVLDTADRRTQISDGEYKVGSVSFAFLVYDKEGWHTARGAYLSYVRKPEDYKTDGKLDFLGTLVSADEVAAAIARHGELVPRLALQDKERAAQPIHTPLADERIPVLKAWLATGNPLLAISALIDAYEIADEGMPITPGVKGRPLPPELVSALQDIALVGFKQPGKWVHSAAIAVVERVGVPAAARDYLRAICKAKFGEDLSVVRQEAYRLLGRTPGLERADLEILVAGLPDPTLINEVDGFIADGITEAAKQSADNVAFFVEAAEKRFGSQYVEERRDGLRIVRALDTPAAYEKLFAAHAKEADETLKGEMLSALGRWADVRNVENLKTLVESKTTPDGMTDNEALGALLKVGEKESLLEWFSDVHHKSDKPVTWAVYGKALLGHGTTMRCLLGTVQPRREPSDGAESIRAIRAYTIEALRLSPDCEDFEKYYFNDSLAVIRNTPDPKFGREIIDVWWTRFASPQRTNPVARPAPRDIEMPKEPQPLEYYALGWIGAKDKALWEAKIIEALGDGTTKDAAYVMELIARFKLKSALEPLKKMPAGEPSWRGYLRAQAIAALDAEAGAAAFKEFYETIPLDRLLSAGRFGMPSLGDSVLNRAECKTILPRLVAALESADKNQGTPVAQITLTLSRLTGYYDGYVTTAANDAASVKLLAQRWRTWYDANEKKLAWDDKLGRFVAR